MRFPRRDPPPPPLAIQPYQRRYRQAIRDMLFRHENTHLHLDWQESEAWLDGEEGIVRLAFSGTRLVGILAFSEPLYGTTWLRIASLHDMHDPLPILTGLWADAAPALHDAGVSLVAVLCLRDWIGAYLSPLGFAFRENIVTLRRAPPHNSMFASDELPLPPEILPARVTLRAFEPLDIDAMIAVDQRAFAPPWQMSGRELRQAQRVAAHTVIAERDGRVIGYQLSTIYFDGAHLARLAVDPSAQGVGVGAALVANMIQYFGRRGVSIMTVNTQESNLRSQRVYERAGFRRNGYDLAVWTAAL
jgi:ribosomal-protein-alanine N-acetyltransferase